MIKLPVPCHQRARTGPVGHSPDIARAPTSADLLESAMWPYLPHCAARALSVTLLLIMAAGVLSAFTREVHAQSTEVLLSNGEPPPSARLLLVNLTQRHVAQEFTTGLHPAGYDVYSVAVRTENSNGKQDMGLQGRIRNRRWEPVGPWNIMLPHRQVGPTLMRSRPIADSNWSWFTSSEPIHLEPNETYFFELVCRWGCFVITNGVGLGLTESNDEDDSTLPGWSMADGFIIQNARFNRWWGDMVVGTDGFFHPDPEGPVLRLAIRGEPREIAGLSPGDSEVPQLSASDVRVREAPHARLAFPITLSSASTQAVAVRYETADGTATAGADYVPASGRLVFAPGQTLRTIEVAVLHDARGERTETLTLRLSGASGARIEDPVATGTIVNAGPPPREWMARQAPTVTGRFVETAGAEVSAPVDRGRNTMSGFEAIERAPETKVGAATGTIGAVFRPSRRAGEMAVSDASGNHVYAAPAGGEERERAETMLTRMSPCLRLALSEPVSRWDGRRCDDG